MDKRLEERYIVIKLKHLHEKEEQYIRDNYDHCFVDAAVIEQDWPEHKPVVDMLMGRIAREKNRPVVKLPACMRGPDDWYCTRGAGHDGPCAMVKV